MGAEDKGKDGLGLTTKVLNSDPAISPSLETFKYGDDTWVCGGYIEEADRDLKLQEPIYLYVIDRGTGAVVKNFWWWPYKAELTVKALWPRYVAYAITQDGDKIQAGEPDKSHPNVPAWISGVSSSGAWKVESLPTRNRWWYVGEANRAFTTLPQKNNWVRSLDLNKVDLAADARLEIAVQDRTSGTVYETRVFTPTADRLKAAEWQGDFYKLINSKAGMLKAGDMTQVGDWNDSPPSRFDSQNTALWTPKGSDLELVVTSSGSRVSATSPGFTFISGLVTVRDSNLPDMTGFEPDELGVPTNSWLSPSYLLADRDLEKGETLHTWLIRLADGEPLEHVAFTATQDNLLKTQWPQAFAKSINAQAKQITAGGWNDEGAFTDLSGTATPKEFPALDIIGQSKLNRLWHYSREYRAFSTAAFSNNWVQTLTLGDKALDADTTLWVQVRDITSQYLYETHIFSPAAKRLKGAQWGKDLSEQITRDGQMLKAGVLTTGTGKIEPRDQQNSLWVPQCSDLAVTLMPVTWWTQQSVTAERDLKEDESIYTYVWDDFSNAELIPPHCFTPASADERKQANWISAWARSLNASNLTPYVRLAGTTAISATLPSNATQASIWQVGAPLRVFTTEPSDGNWVSASVSLTVPAKDALDSIELWLVHELTQRGVYHFTSLQSDLEEKLEEGSYWLSAEGKSYIRNAVALDIKSKARGDKRKIYNFSISVPLLSGMAIRLNSYTATPPESLRADFLQSLDPTPKSSRQINIWAASLMDETFTILEYRPSKPLTEDYLKKYRLTENEVVGLLMISKPSTAKNIFFRRLEELLVDDNFEDMVKGQPLYDAKPKAEARIMRLLDDFFTFENTPKLRLIFDYKTGPDTRLKRLINSFCAVIDQSTQLHHDTLVLRLTPEARSKKIRMLSVTLENIKHYDLEIYALESTLLIYLPEDIKPELITLAYAAVTNASTLWGSQLKIPFITFIADEGPTPTSPLCEDYGNTFRSEVFDVSGQNSTGVDPRTGLFNAHYSIGTLVGLEGKGPLCDLTLHYSPLRANESGLGDGWAFNFSWYDSRPRLLTLSGGQTLQFTEQELAGLIGGNTLDKPGLRITATVEPSANTLNTLELNFISGAKELLSLADGLASENNEAFVNGVKSRLEEAKRQIPLFIEKQKPIFDAPWYQTVLETLFNAWYGLGQDAVRTQRYNDAMAAWQVYWKDKEPELIKQVDLELAYWNRPDRQYVPSSISSPAGGALNFSWIRRSGQYLLSAVKTPDTKTTLLTGDYGLSTTPPDSTDSSGVADITSTVTFKLWPDTPDAYTVTLGLKNYLLKTVTRADATGETVVERIQYGYSPDPTLDRVLTCIAESDGSVEKVFYEDGGMNFPKVGDTVKPPLPRVTKHIISPSADSVPLRTDWTYSDNNYLGNNYDSTHTRFEDTAIIWGDKYLYSSTSIEEHGITTQRTWNGLHLQVQEQENAPSGAGKTTIWRYFESSASVKVKGGPLFGLPTAITTTYQDDDPSPAKERAS